MASEHGGTQAFVEEHGLPLMETLKVFLASAQGALTKGARLAPRQIEIDAGVFAAELQRWDLHQELELPNMWIQLSKTIRVALMFGVE